MKKHLLNIISRLENQPGGPAAFFLSFAAIILVRLGLEIFAYSKGVPIDLLGFFHLFFFYLSLIICLIIIIYLLSRQQLAKVAKLVLFGTMLIWLGPTVDLIISKGAGLSLTYLFIPLNEIPGRFIGFFGGSPELGVTYGARTTAVALCLLVLFYIYCKTKNLIKALGGMVLTYTTIFLFSVIPSLAISLEKWNINLTEGDVISSLSSPRNVFSIKRYYLADFFDFEMTLIFFPLSILLLAIIFFIYRQEQARALLGNIRPTRFILQIIALLAGMYLGFKITDTPIDLTMFGLLAFATLFISITAAWLFSLMINDIYDYPIDTISNNWRPLVRKIFTLRQYQFLTVMFLFLSLVGAYILSERFFGVMLILNALSYIYSAPPLRLRRYPVLTTLLIAAGILLAILLGFMMFSENQTFKEFPTNIIFLIILFFTIVTMIKDLKDYAGDKANDIYTVPTILGLKRGKIVLGVLVLLSFLLFPLLFINSLPLFFTSLGFGLASFLLIYDKKFKESHLFALYSLYLAVIFLMTF